MIICIAFVSPILIVHCALFWLQVLVGAFRKIPKATWNAKERYISSISQYVYYFSFIYGIMVVHFAQLLELSGDLNFSLIHFHWTCRLWMFPISSLSSAETILSEISGYKVEVVIVHFISYDCLYSHQLCLLKLKFSLYCIPGRELRFLGSTCYCCCLNHSWSSR